MNAIIVSDLHIGSAYFIRQGFHRLLRSIPEDHELILNGDIIDNPNAKLSSLELRTLELIEQISCRQRVVWIRGNHDNGYAPRQFEKIRFRKFYDIGRWLLIVHGDDFDEIMPRNQTFMAAFKLMHKLRIKLGARPVHVAHYAKKWKTFYKFLRKNIMINAVNCALANGYQAVVCGHTHYPEDKLMYGIRYLNTGAWTEYPTFYVRVNDGELFLRRSSSIS